MKTKSKSLFRVLVFLMLATAGRQFATAHAQGTAFTYQGRLNSGGSPANGSYDVAFTLFATNIIGVAIAGPATNSAVAVTNGLFTTTVDFGNVFTGTSNWLQIAVSTNGANAFSTLSPHQQLTPTPYAIFAENANNLSGLSVQPNSSGAPNLIGGSPVNFVAPGVVGAFIGGGGAINYDGNPFINSVLTDFGVIGGGQQNSIQSGASDSVLGGGYFNSILTSAAYSVLGGGNGNSIQLNASYSVLGGGQNNSIQAYASGSVLGGGYLNSIQLNSFDSVLGGGNGNSILPNASYATIPGGQNNTATNYAFAAGRRAKAVTTGSFVWADSQSADFTSTAANEFLIRASGGVGIGTTTPQAPLNVNGSTRIDAVPFSYGEGLILNLPVDMSAGGGYGGIHFHNASRGGALNGSTIKWSEAYNYTPDGGGVNGGGLAFIQNNANTRLYLASNGNVGIGTTSPGNLLVVGGSGSPAYCNGTTWVNGSDRNSKQDFAPISPQEVLAKVSAMPITEWQYKIDANGIKHIGPMAQDFYTAFGLNGTDDKHIATVDADGVALAAIQGLNEKLEELKTDLNRKDTENAELKKRLTALEEFVRQQKSN